MKVKVQVTLNPDEYSAAEAVEADLRGALNAAEGDVVIERGASTALPRVAELLRSTEDPTEHAPVDAALKALSAADLGSALGFIVCGVDVGLRKAAFDFLTRIAGESLHAPVCRELLSHIVAVLTQSAPAPSKADLRGAASAIVDSIGYQVTTTVALARLSLVLMRNPETVTAAAILLATLVSSRSGDLMRLPEAQELRRVCAQVQTQLPSYESVFIAEGMQWSPAHGVRNLTKTADHQVSNRSVVAMGITAMATSVVVCSSDGSLTTLDTAGKSTAETCSLGDVMATSVDASAATRQLVVAVSNRKEGPKLCLLTEAEGRAAWAERARIDLQVPGAKVVSCVRAMRAAPQFCAAACDSSRGAIALVDGTSGAVTGRVNPHSDVITTLHVPASREHVVMSASRDRTVALFDVRTGSKMASMSVHSSTVTTVSTDGDVVVAAGIDGRVAVCDLRNLAQAVGRRTFDAGVLRCGLGPSHLCAVATQTALHVMSLHSAEMPIARMEATVGSPACNDLAWIPGRGALCVAAGPHVDFFAFEGGL